MKRVLFYLEPVVFRQNPKLLEPWAKWAAQIATANRDSFVSSVCSNRAICDVFAAQCGGRFPFYELSATEFLEKFGFDRYAYARSLYDTRNSNQPRPAASLIEITNKFQPDVVVSFTEAPTLRLAFPNALILYTEVGCFPRLGAPPTFFYDPCGHQAKSVLNTRWEDVLGLATSLTGPMAWDLIRRRIEINESHPAHRTIRDWVGFQKRRGQVIVVALQPRDWITHEGLLGATRQEELIFQKAWANRNDIIVPTYHASEIFSAEMESFITGEAHNVAFPPRDVSVGLTELFVPYVDSLQTISSSVAVFAALSGCHVETLTLNTHYRAIEALNNSRGLADSHNGICAKLMTFMSNKFMEPAADILAGEGYFSKAIDNFQNRVNPSDSLFDLKGWTVERLMRFMGF